jgi:hypothetical protein
MGTGGSVGSRTVQFDFRVTRYATDDEVQQLALLLKEKGQDELRSAMEKLDVGRINPVAVRAIRLPLRESVGRDRIL